MIRPEKMQRHIGLIPDHPTIVWLRGNIKQGTRRQLPNPPIVERRHRPALQHQTQMLDATTIRSDRRTHIDRPLPPRLIGRATDGHATDGDELKTPTSELPDFVGRLETLQNHINCWTWRDQKVLPNGSRLSCGALKKDSFHNLRAPSASS